VRLGISKLRWRCHWTLRQDRSVSSIVRRVRRWTERTVLDRRRIVWSTILSSPIWQSRRRKFQPVRAFLKAQSAWVRLTTWNGLNVHRSLIVLYQMRWWSNLFQVLEDPVKSWYSQS